MITIFIPYFHTIAMIDQQKTILDLLENPDYVILNNPLASPKFVRKVGRGKNEKSIYLENDTYSPKIFYEIASQLTPEIVAPLKEDQQAIIDISGHEFLDSIGASKNNLVFLIDSVKSLQGVSLEWWEDGQFVSSVLIAETVYSPDEKTIKVKINSSICKKIIEIKEGGNFSFLKSNVFRLHNAQAIKLYPFFKSWLNNGRYSTDLERFKKQFRYDTSGYKYWSNLETKVVIPAVSEINEKTDIHVSYEPTGTNLDGKRPRVVGITFSIYKKDDIKLLPKESPTPGESHIDTTDQPGLFDQDETISRIYEILKKIPIEEKPTEATAKVMIENIVKDIGHQATMDGMLGILDTKAKPKTIAFFTKSNLLKYPGYEKAKGDIEEKKRVKRAEEQEKIKKERFIEEIKKEYETAKTKFYKQTFEDLAIETKENLIQELWDSSPTKSVYFRGGDKQQPNSYGIANIAEKVAFPGGYDKQKHLKHFALKNWEIQIDFDEKGEIVIN